ncbi:zf-HC2 domain-containing protein [Desulfonema magnum]|uniref:Zinc finger-containing protein n=1 Tax=Desulfonema magnum TaxID=45655 RepID=A0A975BKX0_9BACT|nr:zf-HC2 domain-containing protein [Desulfonema magnum]QTA86964.1 Putative zinc finger-containing protein [Desulfonema magnum]
MKNKENGIKMECNEVKMLLSEYIEGVTDVRKTKRLEEHLLKCDACRKEFSSLKASKEADSAEPAETWKDSADKIYEHIEISSLVDEILEPIEEPQPEEEAEKKLKTLLSDLNINIDIEDDEIPEVSDSVTEFDESEASDFSSLDKILKADSEFDISDNDDEKEEDGFDFESQKYLEPDLDLVPQTRKDNDAEFFDPGLNPDDEPDLSDIEEDFLGNGEDLGLDLSPDEKLDEENFEFNLDSDIEENFLENREDSDADVHLRSYDALIESETYERLDALFGEDTEPEMISEGEKKEGVSTYDSENFESEVTELLDNIFGKDPETDMKGVFENAGTEEKKKAHDMSEEEYDEETGNMTQIFDMGIPAGKFEKSEEEYDEEPGNMTQIFDMGIPAGEFEKPEEEHDEEPGNMTQIFDMGIPAGGFEKSEDEYDKESLLAPDIQPIDFAETRAEPVRKKNRMLVLTLLGGLIIFGGIIGYGLRTMGIHSFLSTARDAVVKIFYVGGDRLKPEISNLQKITVIKESVTGRFVENSKAGRLFVITGQIKNEDSGTPDFINMIGKIYVKGEVIAQTPVHSGNILSEGELSELDSDTIKKRLLNHSGYNHSTTDPESGNVFSFMIILFDRSDNPGEFTLEIARSSFQG